MNCPITQEPPPARTLKYLRTCLPALSRALVYSSYLKDWDITICPVTALTTAEICGEHLVWGLSTET